jgi:spore maturation protein CgeB
MNFTNFEKNIKELRKVNSALADEVEKSLSVSELVIIETRSGMPSLRVNNISLHSLYDPLKESREWVCNYKPVINNSLSVYVFGLGLGYHVRELCENTGKEITVFEPRMDIIRAALETVDLTPVISRIRIATESKITGSADNVAILAHKPSVGLNRDFFESVQKKLKSRALINRGLKILVVSPVYGGSLPVASYCAAALRKLGHNVELMDNSRFADALFYARDITENKTRYNRLIDHLAFFVSESVMARCEAFKPDLVFALAQAPLTIECLENLRTQKIPTAFWFVEDFRFMDYWKSKAVYYDYFFTIQKGDFFKELEEAGIKNYSCLPMAASPGIHKPCELNENEKEYFGSDISFVGAGYYNRRHFLKGLVDCDFKIWGTDWDMSSELGSSIKRKGERIETEETVKIFNAARININLHSSTYHRGINPFGDFVNPRTFEILSCGGFQLVDRRSGFEGLFEVNEELIVFDDLDDLRQKISYYLNNPEERNKIIKKGRDRVLRNHTYENRMEEMLEYIAEKGFEPPERAGEGEKAAEMIEQAGTDTELGKYLSIFAGWDRVKLSDIIEEINSGDGDVSRPEKIFLLMREFIS